jgi:type I restriction enzyme R subunit
MNAALGSDEDGNSKTTSKTKFSRAMEGRKLGKNASYFAFTATPKTLP